MNAICISVTVVLRRKGFYLNYIQKYKGILKLHIREVITYIYMLFSKLYSASQDVKGFWRQVKNQQQNKQTNYCMSFKIQPTL